MNLDLVIGETNQIESTDKGKLEDIASRVKDLNARLSDIRREQVFQRVSSLTFYIESIIDGRQITFRSGTGSRIQRSI